MKAQIILWLSFGLILYLFRADRHFRTYSSPALWIPGLWLAIISSRPVSYWLPFSSGTSDVEGNPVNMITFLILIVAAFITLQQRGVLWGEFVRRNWALVAIYLFYMLSAVWSPFPLVSLKRLFKDFGCVLMALVLITEINPAEAIKLVFVRVAYVLFPLSVVFIKYFPDIGRIPTRSGDSSFNGISMQKNSLGETVFVFGLIVLWEWFEIRKIREARDWKFHGWVRVGLLLTGVWLLWTCESKTSQMCLALGALTFLGCGRLIMWNNGRRRLIALLAVLVSLIALDKVTGISTVVLSAVGRDATFTGRTTIWDGVLAQRTDPVFGVGFYCFWNTSHGSAFIEDADFIQIKTAHNGYLETYLDGGYVAACLLGILLVFTFRNAVDKLFTGAAIGRMALIFWLLAVIYNYSESDFFRMEPLWLTFILFTMNYPRRTVFREHTELRSTATGGEAWSASDERPTAIMSGGACTGTGGSRNVAQAAISTLGCSSAKICPI